MKQFFTSDTHFNQQRTLELSKRPFSTVEEMNQVMIDNWNSVVGEHDTVYHLGDFGDIGFAKYLNGKIFLLAGNYELRDYTMEELQNTFHCVVNHHIVATTIHNPSTWEATGIVCVHEPSNSDFSKFTLFGHIHKLQMIKRNGLNVGVDCHNFTPLSVEDVLFYKNAVDNHYDEEVFM